MTSVFTGNFTQQEPIPADAIARAIEIMQSGRLHRYNIVPGEVSETVQLELEFASYVGSKYCLAVTSGGYAMTIALRAFGLRPEEPVLTNAFTLAPVPGAIAAVGCTPIFVETTANLVVDLEDLAVKARLHKSRLLLLSHMRGHIVDMDRLMQLCDTLGVAVIEDCAHTMGAAWNGVKSGRHGLVGCYSTQTYKHMNSGEGGLLASDDASFMARATVLSGSYMLFGSHQAGPPIEAFADIKYEMPNCSGRMDNLRAALLRAQLRSLDENCARWNERYAAVENDILNLPGLVVPLRVEEEQFVASSIQFLTPALSNTGTEDFLRRAKARGVEIKWFGATEPVGYTSRWESWRYATLQDLPQSSRVLDHLCDMRLPLTFSLEDCSLIGRIIRECFLESVVAQVQGERFRPEQSAEALSIQ